MSDSFAPALVLDDEQRMLSKTAHEFIRERAPAARLRTFRNARDETGFSRALWQEMASLGWLGLPIPEGYDGLGLGFFDLCVVLEATGRELMPEPFVSTLLLGAQAVLLAGNEVQKKALLPGVAAGTTLLAVAYEERGSRKGLIENLDTVARPVDGGFEISGEKLQVLDGHVADTILVLARSEQGDSSLFCVDRGAPGLDVTRQFRIDGQGAAIVRLNKVQVTDAAVLGELGQGDTILQTVFDRAAVGLAAQMLGGAEQAFADTLAYIKEREQFGAPLGSFQALQHRAVDLYTEIALLRSVVLAAARAVDEAPESLPKHASLAKARASDTFMHVAEEAIQMHGGIGVTDEHDIGFYIKRAHAASLTFGDAAWHRRRWAEIHGY